MTRARNVTACLAAALLLAPIVAGASVKASTRYEGQLDSTFNSKGWVQTAIPSGGGVASSVAIQPNGDIVAVGTNDAVANQIVLVRYLPNGKLDPAFGHLGLVSTTVGQGNNEANAVAIQPDGKIVVVGYTDGENNILVLRYNANGSIDTSFNDGGVVKFGIGSTINIGTSVALQPNGKIVIGGFFYNGSYDNMAVLRYNANGSLDTTFNGTGYQTTTAELAAVPDVANAVAVQPDGKILLAGWAAYANSDTVVVRFDANGALDTSFGTNGISDSDFGGGNDQATAIVALPNGDSVISGYATVNNVIELNVARYDANGTVIADAQPGGIEAAGFGLAVETNGDLAVALLPTPGVVRLHPDLSPDNEFGPALDGISETLTTPKYANVLAVATEPDGDVVGVGNASSGVGIHGFLVARWLGDTMPPTGAKVGGLARYSLAAKQHFTWTALDTGSGVASFDSEDDVAPFDRSVYGSWSTLTMKTAAKTALLRVAPGTTVCVKVRARDRAGNVSNYSAASCTSVALGERSLKAKGAWTKVSKSSYYLGLAMTSSVPGAVLSTTANFRHLAVVVTTCPSCGSLEVFLGSKLLDKVNLASAKTMHRQIIAVHSSKTILSGTVRLVQDSKGKVVTVEGVSFELA